MLHSSHLIRECRRLTGHKSSLSMFLVMPCWAVINQAFEPFHRLVSFGKVCPKAKCPLVCRDFQQLSKSARDNSCRETQKQASRRRTMRIYVASFLDHGDTGALMKPWGKRTSRIESCIVNHKTLRRATPPVKSLETVRHQLAPESKQFLQDNFADTYWSLRAWMAGIAFALPVVIPLAGWFGYGIPWQDSLSAYYHASVPGESEAPMRVWFFGSLCAIALCLVAYKGYSRLENRLLNFAGLSTMCVAALPMQWRCDECSPVSFHYIAAVLLFLALAWVSIGCSHQTLKEADDKTRLVFEPLYYLTGLGMITFPITAWIWTWIIGHKSAHIFWMEFLAIWTFASFWVLKNAELRTTIRSLGKSLEKAAVSGDLEPVGDTPQ